MNNRRTHRRDGAVLVLTLMMILGLTVLLAAYLVLVAGQTRWTGDRHAQTQAFYLAEAGLHQAAWYLMHTAPDGSTDGSWRTSAYPAPAGGGGADPREETLATGTYTVWVEASGGNVLMTAQGEIGGLRQTVQQEATVVPGSPNTVTPVPGTWRKIQG